MQGVASALIAAAYQHASQIGVRHLYVHTYKTQAALSLLSKHGFEFEQEEDEEFARALERPQTILLHKSVPDADLLPSDPLHFGRS